MTSGERLRLFRENRGLNQTQISKVLNIPPRNWSRYETDQTSPPQDVLVNLAKLGLDVHWYMTGEGEMSNRLINKPDDIKVYNERLINKPSDDSTDINLSDTPAENIIESPQRETLVVVDGGVEQGLLIPVIAQGLSAGLGLDYEEGEIIRYVKIPAWLARRSQELVALPIYGESMEPTLSNGDLAVCGPGGFCGDGVYMLRDEERGLKFCKRVIWSPGGWTIVSDNAKYEPMKVDDRAIEVVARVIAAIKEVK